MLTKRSLKNAKRYCCEDISLIENYKQAIDENDKRKWVCHHRKGIELNKSQEELIEIGLYYKRPACELMFLTQAEHRSLHHKGKHISQETREKMSISKIGHTVSQETRQKISIARKGKHLSQETLEKLAKLRKGVSKKKYQWKTPNGEIKTMGMRNAKYYHPDWVLIGPA